MSCESTVKNNTKRATVATSSSTIIFIQLKWYSTATATATATATTAAAAPPPTTTTATK